MKPLLKIKLLHASNTTHELRWAVPVDWKPVKPAKFKANRYYFDAEEGCVRTKQFLFAGIVCLSATPYNSDEDEIIEVEANALMWLSVQNLNIGQILGVEPVKAFTCEKLGIVEVASIVRKRR